MEPRRPESAACAHSGHEHGWDLAGSRSQGVELDKNQPRYQLALGMAEYRSGHFAEADVALRAAAKWNPNGDLPQVGTMRFIAMSLYRLGKADEARKLATEAAAKMKPLPKDEKNPLAGDATHDDLILWLAYKERKP